MKLTTSFLSLAAVSIVTSFATAFLVTNVFADAANTLVVFSSPGIDRYAKGEAVVDGEYYALVWMPSDNPTFQGFTTAGEAIDSTQRVLYKARLAKNGRCPLTLFQIDSKEAPVGGCYAVYLLDTRGSTESQFIVTGSALAKSYSAENGSAGSVDVTADNTVDDEGNSVPLQSSVGTLRDDDGRAAPRIVDFKLVESEVKITVANIFPGFAYEVKGGLDREGDIAIKGEATEDGKIDFTVDKEAAQFFSIEAK